MSIEKARNHLAEYGMEDRILEFDVSSATVELAAIAVGVEGARICKTLSFKDPDGGCILVQTAGDSRIDNSKFKKYFGFKAKMLPFDEVEALTGHEPGGVCAFGADHDLARVYCDVSLKRFETVFPACGSDNSAIEMTCDELFKVSEALEWIDVSKLPDGEK